MKIIPEAVTVFDGPNRTTAVHAETEDLHDHVEVSAQTTEFATDDEIAFVDMVEQFAQLSFGIRLCAGNCFFNPSVHGDTFPKAKPVDFKTNYQKTGKFAPTVGATRGCTLNKKADPVEGSAVKIIRIVN